MFANCLTTYCSQVNGKFSTKTMQDEQQHELPTLYTGLQLQHLEIDTKHEKLLFIEQFTIDSKVMMSYGVPEFNSLLNSILFSLKKTSYTHFSI